MALIKEYTLKNGLEAPNAYHLIHKIDTFKRAVDDEDPAGARPENSPEFAWKAGYYARISVSVYASKTARETGKAPIAAFVSYPTDLPMNFTGEYNTEPLLTFSVDINSSKSVVEQAYDHLTAMDYYKDAVRD